MTNLSSTIKTIQNIMRKDSGVDGDAQRIGQLSWMLFLKIFSDSEENWSFYEEGYESPIPAELQWSAWASDDEGITGDELLDFVNNKLFPTLKNLPTEGNKRAYMIRSIFEDAFNYMKSGQILFITAKCGHSVDLCHTFINRYLPKNYGTLAKNKRQSEQEI